MKKHLLVGFFACALLASAPVAAQTVWAPTGAEWWYQMLTIAGPGYVRAWADSSLTVQGQPSQRIKVQQYLRVMGTNQYVPSLASSVITSQLGNVVQVWNGRQFEPLFDLGWAVGDSWSMTANVPCTGRPDTALVTVDSVGVTAYGNYSLRFRRLRESGGFMLPGGSPFSEYTGMVVERLGYPAALIKPTLKCGTDPEYYQLISYSDTDLTFGTRPTFQLLAAPKAIAEASIRISPNPSADGRYQLAGAVAARYEVFDAQGRRVSAGQLPGDAALDLRAQPAGLYVLRLTDDAGRTVSRRLVRD